jgi:hypothetical protein
VGSHEARGWCGGGAADTVAYDASVLEFDQTLALVYLLSRYRGVAKRGLIYLFGSRDNAVHP